MALREKYLFNYLINGVLKVKGKAHRDFDNLRKNVAERQTGNRDNTHLDNITIVCLGDYQTYLSLDKMKKKRGTKQ